jgi:hypothetical protein
MVKVLAVMILLAVAQLIPSCSQNESANEGSSAPPPIVIGWVEEKRTNQDETLPHLIVINSREYGVPRSFWLQVRIGDLVKLTANGWSIVKKAGS